MKCHSVRVNLRGSEDNLYNWKQNSIENLNKLCEYAKPLNINIIVENHGDFSSKADHLIDVIENVNHQNVGTLPDFGNWCESFKSRNCFSIKVYCIKTISGHQCGLCCPRRLRQ